MWNRFLLQFFEWRILFIDSRESLLWLTFDKAGWISSLMLENVTMTMGGSSRNETLSLRASSINFSLIIMYLFDFVRILSNRMRSLRILLKVNMILLLTSLSLARLHLQRAIGRNLFTLWEWVIREFSFTRL